MIILWPLLVAATPSAFGTIEEDYEDCGVLLNNFLAKDTNKYLSYTLNLPACNSTARIAQENNQCDLDQCDALDPNLGDKFPCLSSFCITTQFMATQPTCKLYVCNATNFFEAEYGFSGLAHGPGTMHPCGRAFAMQMVDHCYDMYPSMLYPSCGPLGPGDPPEWRDLADSDKVIMSHIGWTEDAWKKLKGIENLPAEKVPGKTEFPLIERTCWEDLTVDEQNKLSRLKWNPEGWVTCGYLAKRLRKLCPLQPTSYPAENANCMKWRRVAEEPLWRLDSDQPLGTDRKLWDSLDVVDRKQWEVLGFNNESWNTGDFQGFKLRAALWSELNATERHAAKHFRFNIFSWDGCPHMDCLDQLAFAERLTYPTTVTREWRLLTEKFTEWMTILGWNGMSWTNGEKPIQMSKAWESIDPQIRITAKIFGHNKDTWQGCPYSSCLKRLRYLGQKWWPGGTPIDWNTMPPQWQQDWINLGYTMQSWSDKGKPTLHYTSWDALTAEQKQSARNQGYSMSAWDGCANPQRTEETRDDTNIEEDPYRLIQAKMTIHRSFTEISVEGLVSPSFIRIFENAVSRAMFCRNEFEKDFMGQCYDRDSYQRQANRLLVVGVDQVPVTVHFRILANRTEDEIPALRAIGNLSASLEDPDSSIRTDQEFERFAKVAKVVEVPFDAEAYQKEREEERFEVVRKGDTTWQRPVDDGAPPLLSLMNILVLLCLIN